MRFILVLQKSPAGEVSLVLVAQLRPVAKARRAANKGLIESHGEPVIQRTPVKVAS